MCIICVKPQGVEMPSLDIIKECWNGNSDGAGIAYWKTGTPNVIIDKGFMKLKALTSKLDEISLKRDDLAILHFRFATHGLVDRGNCHPFPLSTRIEALRAIYGRFPSAIAHNGVFGNMACHNVMSDTMKFIRGIIGNPLIANNLDNSSIRTLISEYCGTSSKLAILRPGKMLLIGDFIKDEGLLYSNNGYKRFVTSYYDREDANYSSCNNILRKSFTGCELCGSIEKDKNEYREELQLVLCDKCFAFNMNLENS